jgi:type VI secretion system protein
VPELLLMRIDKMSMGVSLEARVPFLDHRFVERAMSIPQAVKTRNQVKSEFRIDQTMIAPTENNPLKFSVSVQEAISRMMNQTDHAYLSGAEAATEAIGNVNSHQLAVLAGTEAALRSVLQRFKPSTLESKFDQNTSAGKAPKLFRKAKYWDFYKILYQEASEAAEDDFQQFFGAEFSSAYQDQLDRLKLSRKGS